MELDTTLLQFMQHYAQATGADIRSYIEGKNFAIVQEVDAKIAALTGQDASILAFIDKMKALLDAVPGTPEFDEGQNLFTLITNKFDAAVAVANSAKDIAEGVQTAVTSIVADLSALAARVLALEAESAALRRDVGGLRTDVDGLTGQLSETFAGFAGIFNSFSNALRGVQ